MSNVFIHKKIYKISRALEVSAFLHLFTATPFSKHAFIRCLNVCAHRRSFLFEEMTECLFLLIDLRRSFFHRLRGSEWVMAVVLCRVPTQRAGLFIPGSTGRRNSFPLFPFSLICISTARCRWRNPDLGGWKCIFFLDERNDGDSFEMKTDNVIWDLWPFYICTKINIYTVTLQEAWGSFHHQCFSASSLNTVIHRTGYRNKIK